MDDNLASRLLVSLRTDRLVLFTGAGLSMSPPSSLPSAAAFCAECATKYEKLAAISLSAAEKTDLEALAHFSLGRNELQTFLLRRAFDWSKFSRNPNKGHAAIADFLSFGGFQSVITTNVDTLVEEAAKSLGEPNFEAALDGNEAEIEREHKTYLKLHGCFVRDKDNTVWCKEQLLDDPLKTRVEKSKNWLRSRLVGKDLVFLGFWSDWSYLNFILENCVGAFQPGFVLVVNPGDVTSLQTKAPKLWDLANRGQQAFFHEKTTGDIFLDELRKRYLRSFLEQALDGAKSTYLGLVGAAPTCAIDFPSSSTEALFAIKQDMCGVGRANPAREKTVNQTMNTSGAAHLMLREKNALLNGSAYELSGKSYRIVSGAGQLKSSVKERVETEVLGPVQPDFIVCAGALSDSAPSHILRTSNSATILRHRSTSAFCTLEEIKTHLAI